MLANFTLGLLHGMVWETDVESETGKGLYSDFATGNGEKDTQLNQLVRIPFIGIVAGLARIALGIIHTVGHLVGALLTFKKGHLFHAAKGSCEILRGVIETIPVIGRIFAYSFSSTAEFDFGHGGRSWWMIKIYNPQKPDGLDQFMNWWKEYPKCYYVKA